MSEKIKRFRWTGKPYVGEAPLIWVPGGYAAGTYDITMEPVEPERVGEKGPAPEPERIEFEAEARNAMEYVSSFTLGDETTYSSNGLVIRVPEDIKDGIKYAVTLTPKPSELNPCPRCGGMLKCTPTWEDRLWVFTCRECDTRVVVKTMGKAAAIDALRVRRPEPEGER